MGKSKTMPFGVLAGVCLWTGWMPALAQAPEMPPPMYQPPPPMYQSPPPAAAPEGGSTRGLFLALFLQQLAPDLAAGIGSWFKNKLNGGNSASASMPPPQMGMSPQMGMPPAMDGGMPQGMSSGMPQGMNSGMPQGMNSGMPQGMNSGMPASMPPMPEGPQMGDGMPAPGAMPMSRNAPVLAGVAFQVSLVGADGRRTLIDPAQRTFATGEKFEIAYRPNFPGVVEVYNIDPVGKEERIDRVQLGAAQLATLGPYEFVDAKGSETLRIVLRPCMGSVADAPGMASRGITRAQIRPELAGALMACDDRRQQQLLPPARGIARVSNEGGTNYALDPVSKAEIDSGRLAAREVLIRFVHN